MDSAKDKKIIIDEDLYFAILIFMKKLEMQQVEWFDSDSVNQIYCTEILNIGIKIFLKEDDYKSIQFELFDADGNTLYIFNNNNCDYLFKHHGMDCKKIWNLICKQNNI